MFEDDEKYKSETCKKIGGAIDLIPPFIGTPGLILTIVSMFYGGWLETLGLVLAIIVAAYITFKLAIRLQFVHASMMETLKWDYTEWDTYGRVRNVVSRKLFSLLPMYIYTVAVLYFITGLETNIQKLGLTGLFLAFLALMYGVVVEGDYNLEHHAAEAKTVFVEVVLIVLALVCVAIGNFFVAIEFVDITMGLGLIVAMTTIYLGIRPLTPMETS